MHTAIHRRDFVTAMVLGAAEAAGLCGARPREPAPAHDPFAWVRACPRRLMVGFHVPDYDQEPAYRELEKTRAAPPILASFDARKFARALRQAHVQAFWFYAKCHRGNAYYPSKVGHVHSAMRGRDFFGELCEACLSEGIVPLCVYEFSDLRMRVDHPDWCHRIPPASASAGGSGGSSAEPRLGGPCLNGPYGEFVLEQTREILRNYPIKGYYVDFLGLFDLERWICPHCGRKYEKAFGRPFPGATRMAHDEYVRYVRWWYRENDEYAQRMRRLVRDLRPDVLFTHNFHGWTDGPHMQRMDFASRNCDFVTGDLFQLRDGMLQMSWKIRACAALSRVLPADVLLDSVTCVQGDFHTPKALATYRAEMWTARSVNAGTTASVVVGIDGTFSPHVLELVRKVYAEQEACEPWLRDMQPLADVGIVRSHDSLDFRPAPRGEANRQPAPHGPDFRGWCQAVIAAHHLWDLLPAHLLDAAHLQRFRAVILPSTSCMSAEECAAIRAFVRQGGALVATGETSLFDQDGRRLSDFQLADVFGAHFVEDSSRARGYLRIEAERWRPRAPWVESTLAMKEGQLGVQAAGGAEELATVYAHPGLSLVNVQLPTGEPALLRNRYGAGTCYYFAGAIGLQYRRYGQANVRWLMSRVLGEAVGAAGLVALEAPASVELFAHTQRGQDHLVVSLVNVFPGLCRSDGWAFNPPAAESAQTLRHEEYDESPRLSQIVLRFRNRHGKPFRRAWLAPDKQELPARREGSETLVTLHDLAEHALIVAEYED